MGSILRWYIPPIERNAPFQFTISHIHSYCRLFFFVPFFVVDTTGIHIALHLRAMHGIAVYMQHSQALILLLCCCMLDIYLTYTPTISAEPVNAWGEDQV